MRRGLAPGGPIGSQVVEEGDDGVGRVVPPWVTRWGRDAVESALFERKVCVKVDVGGPLLFVTQPQGDR